MLEWQWQEQQKIDSKFIKLILSILEEIESKIVIVEEAGEITEPN